MSLVMFVWDVDREFEYARTRIILYDSLVPRPLPTREGPGDEARE